MKWMPAQGGVQEPTQRSSPTNGLVTAVAVVGGVAAAWVTGFAGAMIDLPAPPWLSWLGAVIALAMALLRSTSSTLALLLSYLALGLTGSMAVGSSWAAATWWPVFVAVFSLSSMAPAFLLTMTATVLLREAPTLAILYGELGAARASGSSAYFAGFVGAVAIPAWFTVAAATSKPLTTRAMSAMACLVTTLAAWSVFMSGSRAALLASGFAAVGWIVAWRMGAYRTVSRRDALLCVALVIALLPMANHAVSWLFTGGATGLSDVVESRIRSTAEDIATSGPSSISTRLALWQQSASALLARPLGHGTGSYPHVILGYQGAPMLWSGDPHSVWAKTAVESGAPGLFLLLVLVAGGAWAAWRRGSKTFGALLAATTVMSLDVFASFPALSLIWWATLGSAWGPSARPSGRWQTSTAMIGTIAVVGIAMAFSVRFATPCEGDCNPVTRFGGHPKVVGHPSAVLGRDLDGATYRDWADLYPYAFWLHYHAAIADHTNATNRPTLLQIVRWYPYHGARAFIAASVTEDDPVLAASIAACGLVRIYDGSWIWRDWRSSEEELVALRLALEARAHGVAPVEESCAIAQIPDRPLGLRRNLEQQ